MSYQVNLHDTVEDFFCALRTFWVAKIQALLGVGVNLLISKLKSTYFILYKNKTVFYTFLGALCRYAWV